MIEIEKQAIYYQQAFFSGHELENLCPEILSSLYVNLCIYLDVSKIDSRLVQQFIENEISIPKYVDNLCFRF